MRRGFVAFPTCSRMLCVVAVTHNNVCRGGVLLSNQCCQSCHGMIGRMCHSVGIDDIFCAVAIAGTNDVPC